jgi:cell shape-determining protein MreC
MTQNQAITSVTQVDNEQEAVKEYVDGLENNIEYYKEWAAIYKTQRDIARSKVSQLEMKVLQLQHIILQNERMH